MNDLAPAVGSDTAVLPLPNGMRHLAAYSASKFGVAGFTEALRQELLARSAVQVCCSAPGC